MVASVRCVVATGQQDGLIIVVAVITATVVAVTVVAVIHLG